MEFYNLHLESRGNDRLRLSQLKEVLSDAARQDAQRPLFIAGDFNLNVSKNNAVSELAKTGFQDAIAAPRTPTTPSHHLLEPEPRSIGHSFADQYALARDEYTIR